MRLPLQTTAEFRSIDETKDSITVNGFVEIESETERYVFKRPGLFFGAQGAGTANGAFSYGDNLYYWDSDTTATSPNIIGFWNPNTSYIGGSGTPILYPEGPWYPITPVVGEPPSEPNWSKVNSKLLVTFDAVSAPDDGTGELVLYYLDTTFLDIFYVENIMEIYDTDMYYYGAVNVGAFGSFSLRCNGVSMQLYKEETLVLSFPYTRTESFSNISADDEFTNVVLY